MGTPRGWVRTEDGSLTIFGLFAFATCCAIGALAFDVSKLVAARTQLQAAADAAAHAAIYWREDHSPAEARARAIEIARTNMPSAAFGEVLRPENIHFGRWDDDGRVFEIDPSDTLAEAVMVRTDRLSENGNPVSAILMQFVGIPAFDVVTSTVFEAYVDPCAYEGFLAAGPVDMQSNNAFTNGFCIHGAYVKVGSGNYFEDGVVVSMPDTRDIEMPTSGFESNPGLEESLRNALVSTRILNRLTDIYENYDNPQSPHYRDWIRNGTPKRITGKKPAATDFKAGNVYEMWCGAGAWFDGAPLSDVRTVAAGGNGNGSDKGETGETAVDPGKATMPGELVSDIVLITDCALKFNEGAALENVLIINFNTSPGSFNAPSGLRLGRDDDCAVDGGAQLVTWGGLDVASKLEMYGSQIIARKNVVFAANADGIRGAAIVSGGTIDGASNMAFGNCDTGMEDNFVLHSFRMRS